MKRKSLLFAVLAVSVALAACAPALSRSAMREGDRSVSFSALRDTPDASRGRLFIFGGVIVRTRLTEEGTRIEAMHVPVDRYGYFKDDGQSEGRFLAIVPKDSGMLDPEVYSRGRRITLAAVFTGTRTGKIDEVDYEYPVFRVRELYLWPRDVGYYYPPYYYDPWFYPFPYYYRYPWWRYPHYYRPVLIDRRNSPERTPAPSRSPAPQTRTEPGRRPGENLRSAP